MNRLSHENGKSNYTGLFPEISTAEVLNKIPLPRSKWIFIWVNGLLLLMAGPVAAQNQIRWLWEPELSYTYKLSNRWSTNLKFGVQQAFNEVKAESNVYRYQINYTQLQGFVTYQLWTTTQLSAGYGFRFNDLLDPPLGREHRWMEQINFLFKFGETRLANRFRAEQRLEDGQFTNRFRYRLACETPLQGQRLDPGEKYFITSNELLFSVNARESFAENRIYVGIGWFFSQRKKMETGLQYRLARIGTGNVQHMIWLTTAYYLNQK